MKVAAVDSGFRTWLSKYSREIVTFIAFSFIFVSTIFSFDAEGKEESWNGDFHIVAVEKGYEVRLYNVSADFTPM